MAPKIEISPMAESDWERLRDLRLEMLRDSPTAYLESLPAALAVDDEGWRFRARRAGVPGSTGLVAWAGDRLVGTMSARTDAEAGKTWLVAVYVAATCRGLGVADLLLDAVEAWAVGDGRPRLWLEVHEGNARAQRFYLRRGFAFTGGSRAYPADESQQEYEMVRTLFSAS
jgi:GNAT superfamily N-acetyltransferase